MIKLSYPHVSNWPWKKIILLVFWSLSACRSQMNEPGEQFLDSGAKKSDEGFSEDAPFAAWDPEAALAPGINLLTFSSRDRVTTWPYFRSQNIYPIRFVIMPEVNQSLEALLETDPGIYRFDVEYRKGSGAWQSIVVGQFATVTLEQTVNWEIPVLDSGADYQLRIRATSMGFKEFSLVSDFFVVDRSEPILQSFTLHTGTPGVSSADVVNRLFFRVRLQAQDDVAPIAKVCVKTALLVPDFSDTCWQSVEQNQQALNVNSLSIPAQGSLDPGTYTLYAWVQNRAGLVSNPHQSLVYTYAPGRAPIITNLLIKDDDDNDDSLFNHQNIGASASIYLKWSVTDPDGNLPGAPIQVEYTHDNLNWLSLSQSFINGANGACDMGVTYTGCAVISNPTGSTQYFNLRVKATDDSGLSAIQTWSGLNIEKVTPLVGNTSKGLGSSADQFIFINPMERDGSIGEHALAVDSVGTFYFLDLNDGLLRIDPDTKQVVPLTKGNAVCSGAGVSAMNRALCEGEKVNSLSIHLDQPRKISVDFQDRLLVMERRRIRRLTKVSVQGQDYYEIETLIGDLNNTLGNNAASAGQVAHLAKDFQFNTGNHSLWQNLVPLPNGDVWFSWHVQSQILNATNIGIYRQMDQRVYQLRLSGKGARRHNASTDDPNFEYDVNNSLASSSFGLIYQPESSQVQSLHFRLQSRPQGQWIFHGASFNPRTGVSVLSTSNSRNHIRPAGEWRNQTFVVGQNGKLYAYRSAFNAGIYLYEQVNGQMEDPKLLVGTGTSGECEDGTLATACPVDIRSLWVTRSGQLYFLDKSRIRTLDAQGALVTVFGRTTTESGGLARQARFLRVVQFGRWNADDKVVVSDIYANALMESNPSDNWKMTRLAGGRREASPSISMDAADTDFSSTWGTSDTGIVVDPDQGNIYSEAFNGNFIYRLLRSSGRWEFFLGSNSTSWPNHFDNLNSSSNMSFDQVRTNRDGRNRFYISGLSGANFEGDQKMLLVGRVVENSSGPFLKNFKLLSLDRNRARHFIGGSVNYVSSNAGGLIKDVWRWLPLPGQNLTSSFAGFPARAWGAVSISHVYYHDGTQAQFYMTYRNERSIYKAVPSYNGDSRITGVDDTLSSLSFKTMEGIQAYQLRRETGQDVLYYCGSSGRILKKSSTQALSEDPLSESLAPGFPMDGNNQPIFPCQPSVMHWSHDGEKLYFIYRKESLYGIASLDLGP